MTTGLPELALPAKISALDAFLFRVPLKTPRVNAFGKMTHRPALVVRLRDEDGAEGWGECFCNWPAFAAEHRFRIITELLSPLLMGERFQTPVALSEHLTARTRSLRIQSDERGPFDQSIAAVDIAAWDLASRRAGVPLYQALGGGKTVQGVPVYASGLTAGQAISIAERDVARGIRAFKLKVGFGLENDLHALAGLRDVIGDDADLMVDANQGWNLAEAEEAIRAFEGFRLGWVEEPIAADCRPEDFNKLAALGTPIAAGENIREHENFADMMTLGGLSVVQPDIIKWGGITQCWEIARGARDRGLRYCPHYLGGGIGLMATAHLLAAAGGDGLLELDATDNPLRTLLADPFPPIEEGVFPISDAPGLGVAPDMRALEPYLVQGDI